MWHPIPPVVLGDRASTHFPRLYSVLLLLFLLFFFFADVFIDVFNTTAPSCRRSTPTRERQEGDTAGAIPSQHHPPENKFPSQHHPLKKKLIPR